MTLNTPEASLYSTASAIRLDTAAASANSLAQALQMAPGQERPNATALRRRLFEIAGDIARKAGEWSLLEADGAQARQADQVENTLARLRQIAAHLARPQAGPGPGIGLMLQSFANTLVPQALLLLHPSEDGAYRSGEYLEGLDRLLRDLEIDPGAAGGPRQLIVFGYPQGEQNNVLGGCALVRYLFADRSGLDDGGACSQAFAAMLLGPALFFALASGPASAEQHAALAVVHPVLERLGWLEDQTVGHLLAQWPGRGQSAPVRLDEYQAAWQQRYPDLRPFSPADMEKTAPILWRRIEQLLPPNDLSLDSVESVNPADTPAILNAGWSLWLLRRESLFAILGSRSAEDRWEARQVLNRLIIKAIELANVSRRWSVARNIDQARSAR